MVKQLSKQIILIVAVALCTASCTYSITENFPDEAFLEFPSVPIPSEVYEEEVFDEAAPSDSEIDEEDLADEAGQDVLVENDRSERDEDSDTADAASGFDLEDNWDRLDLAEGFDGPGSIDPDSASFRDDLDLSHQTDLFVNRGGSSISNSFDWRSPDKAPEWSLPAWSFGEGEDEQKEDDDEESEYVPDISSVTYTSRTEARLELKFCARAEGLDLEDDPSCLVYVVDAAEYAKFESDQLPDDVNYLKITNLEGGHNPSYFKEN